MLKYDPMDEAIKLWFEYKDKDINYKNWWNMKDNIEGGILNKDFIKKHLIDIKKIFYVFKNILIVLFNH